MNALEYNKLQDWAKNPSLIKRMQETVGSKADGILGPNTIEAFKTWQKERGLDPDGKIGPNSLGKFEKEWNEDSLPEDRDLKKISQEDTPPPALSGETKVMDLEDKIRIVDYTVLFEGGRGAKAFSACNRDGEYEGRFDRPKKDKEGNKIPIPDRPKKHWASKYGDTPTHIGLSYGAWQFTQDSGSLYKTLRQMHEDDPALFNKVFGGSELASELLKVTGRKGKGRINGRSSRVQRIGGADLWKEPWLSRFREAGKHKVFQDSQKKQVIARYLDRAISTAKAYGFNDEKSIAVLFDISIQMGVGGMRKYVRKALGKAPASPAWGRQDVKKVIQALKKPRRSRRLHIHKIARDVTYSDY